MNNVIKKQEGVSLIVLVLTVIVLGILVNVLVFNANQSIHIKKLTKLYNDLEVLRSKTTQYYNEYGEIPAKIKYNNIENIEKLKSQNNDTGDFFVLDLEAMSGLILNYGKDYEKIKDDIENVNNYNDLYIINKNSHNIFYIRGVKIKEDGKETIYYTDYKEPDDTTVEVRYIDGILIPEGYKYIGKEKDENGKEIIQIQEIETQDIYVWNKLISHVHKVPDSITLNNEQDENEFIKSVNIYKGYFGKKGETQNRKIVYLKINENEWSQQYTKEMDYTDIQGNTLKIPKGFKVSMSPTMNVINNGFVAKDENENEWVWISVPEEVFQTAESNSDYENIKADLVNYAEDYRKGSINQECEWDDEYYQGCGIKAIQGKTAEEVYNDNYKKMLTSIYENKGFWISRYEAGTTSQRTGNMEITEDAKSQKDLYPYNYITIDQAEQLSENIIDIENRTSSLLFGIQWDLVCKFIEKNSYMTYEDIAEDSKMWGNYKDSQIKIDSKNAEKYNLGNWIGIISTKQSGESNLLTTGSSEQLKSLGIYDFAGNSWELVIENTYDEIKKAAVRGGVDYEHNGSDQPAAYRDKIETGNKYSNVGFRITIY